MKAVERFLLIAAAVGGWVLAGLQLFTHSQAQAGDFRDAVISIVESCLVSGEAQISPGEGSADLEDGEIDCPLDGEPSPRQSPSAGHGT